MEQLRQALADVSRVPRLLVASDFDGTVSPIVNHPADARALPAAAAALWALADLADTTVALISGRSVGDLAALSGAPPTVVLIGSHGAESSSGFTQEIDGALLSTITDTLTAIAVIHPGVTVEPKPASVALHVRNAAADDASAALSAALAASHGWQAELTEGKAVLEFAVVKTGKGEAVNALRVAENASAVVYFGDDVTDEKAFSQLWATDVGIKVGPGDTAAGFRVDSPDDVADALEFLRASRAGYIRLHQQ